MDYEPISSNNPTNSHTSSGNNIRSIQSPGFNTFAWSDTNDLRPVEEIPHPYQQVFADYPNFNVIQSKVLDDVFYSDVSLVIAAPTGSGKTAIFELAIVKVLIAAEKKLIPDSFKMIYICPMKALCEERIVDWHKKFSDFNLKCISVTGDSDNIEISSLLAYNLIITTPEKWDCVTRKWKENIMLVHLIKLFMIDEVHLLHEDSRGSTLETVVCRMKTIENSCLQEKESQSNKIRFIAVSATIANIEDIAEWIGKPPNVRYFRFCDEYRPVRLKTLVFGYKFTKTHFKFDLYLNYKLKSLIMEYSHGKPTLIFCSTRKIVEMTAKHLVQTLTVTLNPEQKSRLMEAASQLSDAKIRETLIHGVGFHHAGLLPENRRAIENLFRNNELPILVTTSTLAVGVNLPAHLVIIKSTKTYSNGGFVDYSETAILQMIGRAGRPQFDTSATAIILTTDKDQHKFEAMVGGTQPIESNLHKHLTEHLNAEVVLRTITDLEVAMQWLSSTFLYIRAKKNPQYYGIAGYEKNSKQIDYRLLEMCKIEMNKLVNAGMLTMDENITLRPTEKGVLMARYYLAFQTMKLFTQITGYEVMQQILALISKCGEFSEMYLRVNDKKCLNLLNQCKNGETIRFPLNGRIKTLDMKINCIMQAVLGCLVIGDHSILSETFKVMRNAERITKCLIEYLESKENCYQALLSTVILAKCFKVKLWENSPHVCKQLPGIGNVMSTQLVNAGKNTFDKISQCDPRDIELIINKKSPMGNKILEQVKYLPKYTLKIEKGDNNLYSIIIELKNNEDLSKKSTANLNSLMHLIIGDSTNKVILYEKYAHSYMLENPDVIRIVEIKNPDDLDFIQADFISEDWVGFDCVAKFNFKPEEIPEKPATKKTPKKVSEDAKANGNSKTKKENSKTYMQSFMEIYLKSKNLEESTRKIQAATQNEIQNNTASVDKVAISQKSVEKEDDKNNGLSPVKLIEDEILFPVFKTDQNKSTAQVEAEIHAKYDFGTKEGLKKYYTVTKNPQLSEGKVEFNEKCDSGAPFELKGREIAPSVFRPDKNKSVVSVQEEIKAKYSFGRKKVSKHHEMAKKLELDEKPSEKASKITWRSPLTDSPLIKHSPKIIIHENKILPVTQPEKKKATNFRELLELCKSQELKSTKSPSFFPLRDQDYFPADEEYENTLEKDLSEIAEIASLKNLGLNAPQNVTKSHLGLQIYGSSQNNKAETITSGYYSWLTSQESEKGHTSNEIAKSLQPYGVNKKADDFVASDLGYRQNRTDDFKFQDEFNADFYSSYPKSYSTREKPPKQAKIENISSSLQLENARQQNLKQIIEPICRNTDNRDLHENLIRPLQMKNQIWPNLGEKLPRNIDDGMQVLKRNIQEVDTQSKNPTIKAKPNNEYLNFSQNQHQLNLKPIAKNVSYSIDGSFMSNTNNTRNCPQQHELPSDRIDNRFNDLSRYTQNYQAQNQRFNRDEILHQPRPTISMRTIQYDRDINFANKSLQMVQNTIRDRPRCEDRIRWPENKLENNAIEDHLRQENFYEHLSHSEMSQRNMSYHQPAVKRPCLDNLTIIPSKQDLNRDNFRQNVNTNQQFGAMANTKEYLYSRPLSEIVHNNRSGSNEFTNRRSSVENMNTQRSYAGDNEHIFAQEIIKKHGMQKELSSYSRPIIDITKSKPEFNNFVPINRSFDCMNTQKNHEGFSLENIMQKDSPYSRAVFENTTNRPEFDDFTLTYRQKSPEIVNQDNFRTSKDEIHPYFAAKNIKKYDTENSFTYYRPLVEISKKSTPINDQVGYDDFKRDLHKAGRFIARDNTKPRESDNSCLHSFSNDSKLNDFAAKEWLNRHNTQTIDDYYRQCGKYLPADNNYNIEAQCSRSLLRNESNNTNRGSIEAQLEDSLLRDIREDIENDPYMEMGQINQSPTKSDDLNLSRADIDHFYQEYRKTKATISPSYIQRDLYEYGDSNRFMPQTENNYLMWDNCEENQAIHYYRS